MQNDTIFFDAQDFSDYGPLAVTVAAEVNTALKEAIAEEKINLDNEDPIPSMIQDLRDDMLNHPDLYVSTSMGREMGIYISQQNPL